MRNKMVVHHGEQVEPEMSLDRASQSLRASSSYCTVNMLLIWEYRLLSSAT